MHVLFYFFGHLSHIKQEVALRNRLPRWFSGKESACNARDVGDAGSSPGLGRSPGVGNGNLLQYSCLENSIDRGNWQGTYSPWDLKESDMTEHTLTHKGEEREA